MLVEEADADGVDMDMLKNLLKMMGDAATERSRTEEEQAATALENVARLNLKPRKYSVDDVYSIVEARRRMQALGIPAHDTGDVHTPPSPVRELRERRVFQEDKKNEEEEKKERLRERQEVEIEMARLRAQLAADGRARDAPPLRQPLPPRTTDVAIKRAVRRNRIVGFGAALLVVFLFALLLLVLKKTKMRLFRRRVPRPQQEHHQRKEVALADGSEKNQNEQGRTVTDTRK